MAENLKPTEKRIQVIDAFRGFALVGIVIVHFVEQFLGNMPPEGKMDALNQGPADGIVQGVVFILFRGKFFALFSLLFGLSFFIQMEGAAKKGVRFEGRFIWRLIILLVIGYVHHLFYRGDILTIYAVMGLLLVPFYKVADKWIWILTGVIFLGTARFIVFHFMGPEPIFGDVSFNPDDPTVISYFNTLKEGSLLDVFAVNAGEGMMGKWNFQIGLFSRGYLTFAFFLIGLLLGRLHFFKHIDRYKKQIRNTLYYSIGAVIITFGVTIWLFSLTGGFSFDSWLSMVAMTFYDLHNLSFTVLVLCGFLLIYMRSGGEKVLKKLAPYGRTALTNYFFQSVLGTFILYHWGLNYLGELRNIHTFGIAILVIGIQVAISRWWLKKFRFGPLEWLWRSLTYMKMQPLVKRPVQKPLLKERMFEGI